MVLSLVRFFSFKLPWVWKDHHHQLHSLHQSQDLSDTHRVSTPYSRTTLQLCGVSIELPHIMHESALYARIYETEEHSTAAPVGYSWIWIPTSGWKTQAPRAPEPGSDNPSTLGSHSNIESLKSSVPVSAGRTFCKSEYKTSCVYPSPLRLLLILLQEAQRWHPPFSQESRKFSAWITGSMSLLERIWLMTKGKLITQGQTFLLK